MQARCELVAFENAVTIGTRTMVSVPYMLHVMQGIDPTSWIYRRPSVFNCASSAGYQTALITAQDFQWRNIDRLFVDADLHHFQQGIEFSPSVNVSLGADDHRVLERGMFPFLARATQNAKPILLVTQMSGSHPVCGASAENRQAILARTQPNSVNAYANTVCTPTCTCIDWSNLCGRSAEVPGCFSPQIRGNMSVIAKPVFMGTWGTPSPMCRCWCFHLQLPWARSRPMSKPPCRKRTYWPRCCSSCKPKRCGPSMARAC